MQNASNIFQLPPTPSSKEEGEVSKNSPSLLKRGLGGVSHPGRKAIQSLFNRIPAQYDFLNSFLSFGSDRYWRKRLVDYAVTHFPRLGTSQGGVSLLDLGVGTGKSLEAFLKSSFLTRAVGCDFSFGMMDHAQKRLGGRSLLVGSDFHHLPFPNGAFDVLTGSFILRSVEDFISFFGEVRRVLGPGGAFFFLELTRPKNKWFWNFFYRPYLDHYLSFVGKVISKSDRAYQFLSGSIQAFVEPEKLVDQLKNLGFISVKRVSLMSGIATIIEGRKA